MNYLNNSRIGQVLRSAHILIKKKDRWSPAGHSIVFSRYICFGFTIFLYINPQACKVLFEAAKPQEEIVTARLKQNVWKVRVC